MAVPSEDDREAVDRAFAEMVAGYHLTADRPELPQPEVSAGGGATEQAATERPTPDRGPDRPTPDPSWADSHPLFRMAEPEPTPPAPRPVTERYVPEPLPPLKPPGVPALLGWLGIGYAVLVVLLSAFGVDLPAWAGWLAVAGFIVGFGILLTRLPRHRPPDAGDGAVL